MDVYKKTKDELNQVGCGFCLAKWTQVTIHLHTGQNHSCHHPATHKISIDEIKQNPSALHNTQYKKEKRKEMLEGKRPAECAYCWNVEDNSQIFSDRIIKSSEDWSLPHLQQIKNLPWENDFNPKYVEVSFSNKCNFKCSYCAPPFSTRWTEEIERFGAYPTSTKYNSFDYYKNSTPYKHDEYNPYVEAFWKWWPELYQDLNTFRITGGEPLLSDDTWNILEYIIENDNPNTKLNFAINSNLGVPDKLIDKLIEKINRIEDKNRVKELILFTSCDSWGEQAEYIRHGLEFNRFWDNVNKILSKTNKTCITFMVTYNALSVASFHKFIFEIQKLKNTFFSTDRYWEHPAFFDVSYLRYPQHQTVQILTDDVKEQILEHANLAFWTGESLRGKIYQGASEYEISKLKRTYDWAISPISEELLLNSRKDFYHFFSEHDKRRGTDFTKVFPELENFYQHCRELCTR